MLAFQEIANVLIEKLLVRWTRPRVRLSVRKAARRSPTPTNSTGNRGKDRQQRAMRNHRCLIPGREMDFWTNRDPSPVRHLSEIPPSRPSNFWNLTGRSSGYPSPEKKTTARFIRTPPACSASTFNACLGDLRSHLNAKNANIGSCPAISNCHK